MDWQIIFGILVALSGYPIGRIVAGACEDELIAGKKWFVLIMIGALVALVAGFVFFKGKKLFFWIDFFIFMFLFALANFVRAKIKSKKEKRCYT